MANSAITGPTLIDFPAGMIMPYAGSTTPAGWLECDGTEKDITAYPTLAAALGTTWNSAKNALTGATYSTAVGKFRVPDMRGAFLRGSTGGANNAQGVATALAEFQPQKTKANGLTATAAASSVGGTVGGSDGTHTHSVSDPGHAHSTFGQSLQFTSPGVRAHVTADQGAGAASIPSNTTGVSTTTTSSGHGHSFSHTAAAQTITMGGSDAETRPDAVGVRYLIKF